jgi:endonuclease III
LVAACLYGGRVDDGVARAAARTLAEAGLADPSSIALARAEALEAALLGPGYPAPDVAARKLWRICHSLAERYGGSLDSLAMQSEQLEDLAARLAGLAPGFGAASVARFLRPLRDRWIQAREIPLHPAARAAAVHLGLLAEGEDEEGEPGALRAALRDDPAQPSLADAEFALMKIGKVACLRNRANRCPLADECPLLADDSRARE